ncbi:MAG: DegT/DnrJ/EryC1/StrS family aminotransferase [Syntrophobacteraceae bacterium]
MTETKRIFLSPPHMGGEEQRFVREAFESNYIAPLGPQVDAFEREFSEKVGVANAVALSSGTAAMHLALRILGVGPGDEVLASTLTFIGSVSPVLFQGGIPVFIDSDRISWNLNPDLLAEELEACEKRGQLPKAAVPTDLYGQCADLNRILEICRPYGIPVVADAAEALGATYLRTEYGGQESEDGGRGAEVGRAGEAMSDSVWNHAGKGAKAAVFSFNGNKIITTSGGGMLVSDDEALIEKARFLSQQARDPAPHYEHSEVGYNYRMSNIVAAIGRGQLRVLSERVERKRQIFEHYREAFSDLPGIEFMPEASYGRCTRWLTVMLIDRDEFGVDRENVRLALEAENIEARPVWKPMHLQPVFDINQTSKHKTRREVCRKERTGPTSQKGSQRYKARVVGGAVSEDLFNRGLCLPSGTSMTDDDLERVVSVIRRVHQRI